MVSLSKKNAQYKPDKVLHNVLLLVSTLNILESTVRLFHIELNQLQPEYYFLPNKEPDLKY